MKLVPRTNEYQHKVIDCPFCPKWVYVRSVSKNSPDALRDLKRHITNDAKNEAFALAIHGEPLAVPHLDYYRMHTSEVPAVPKVSIKRAYDSDLEI